MVTETVSTTSCVFTVIFTGPCAQQAERQQHGEQNYAPFGSRLGTRRDRDLSRDRKEAVAPAVPAVPLPHISEPPSQRLGLHAAHGIGRVSQPELRAVHRGVPTGKRHMVQRVGGIESQVEVPEKDRPIEAFSANWPGPVIESLPALPHSPAAWRPPITSRVQEAAQPEPRKPALRCNPAEGCPSRPVFRTAAI